MKGFLWWVIEDDGVEKVRDFKLIDWLKKVKVVLKNGGDVFWLWL